MKRDMDLIRLLLLRLETGEEPAEVANYSEEQVIYHSALCIEAGLTDGRVVSDENGYPAGVATIKLTWKGHEFLDEARSHTVWNKAKDQIKKSGITVSAAILQEVLKQTAKHVLAAHGVAIP